MPKKNHIALDEETNFFMSTGDLMAALLMVFVLLLAATLLQLINEFNRKVEVSKKFQKQSENYKELAEKYQLVQDQLYRSLFEEFEDDLEEWSAVIDPNTLAIQFQEPDVLFARGNDDVSKRFQSILDDFVPRYIGVLVHEDFKENIEEIRVEGHTSSEWDEGTDQVSAYFLNMRLSQNRTRNVLRYSLGSIDDEALGNWVKEKITANGLSSSKPILVGGKEDMDASRRVEFRVRTDAEEQMSNIIRLSNEYFSTGEN